MPFNQVVIRGTITKAPSMGIIRTIVSEATCEPAEVNEPPPGETLWY